MSAASHHRWVAPGLAALTAVVVMTTAAPPHPVRAQEKAAKAEKADKDKDRARALAPAAVVRQAWSDEQFDNWVFARGGIGRAGDGGADEARKYLTTQAALQIGDIDRVCRIDDAQRKKLQLASRGDIHRLFEGYERAKEKFRALGHDVEQLQEVAPDVAPLQRAMGFGMQAADSLVTKCLRSTLSADQYARYQAAVRERMEARHRAHVSQAVTMIDRIVPLQDEKRRELTDLLLRETKAPRRPHQYEYYEVLMQVSKIPEEKFKAILTDLQWKAVSRFVGQYRGVEQAWRQSGILPKDDEDEEK